MDGRGGPIFVESPSSPLSLMDVITVGSPATTMGGGNAEESSSVEPYSTSAVSESSSSSIVTVASAHQSNTAAILEPPATERLLPIGPASSSVTKACQSTHDRVLDEQGRIFDRVWQVFGSMEKSNPAG